jgi:hypothetical protein
LKWLKKCFEKIKMKARPEKAAEKTVSKNPVPEACRTCYKAYNI